MFPGNRDGGENKNTIRAPKEVEGGIMSHDYRMPIVKRDSYLFLIQGCFIHLFFKAPHLCCAKKKKFKLNHCLFHFSRSQKDLAEFAPKD